MSTCQTSSYFDIHCRTHVTKMGRLTCLLLNLHFRRFSGSSSYSPHGAPVLIPRPSTLTETQEGGRRSSPSLRLLRTPRMHSSKHCTLTKCFAANIAQFLYCSPSTSSARFSLLALMLLSSCGSMKCTSSIYGMRTSQYILRA